VSDFDPIPRLQHIAATLDDGGHFDAPATAAHYINCAIKEIERLRRESGEARREIGDSLQTLIHFRQERDALRAERDEAVRECNRLAQRNTMLVNELSERGRVFTPEQLKAAIVKALYEGEG